jgi:hypothetical protein
MELVCQSDALRRPTGGVYVYIIYEMHSKILALLGRKCDNTDETEIDSKFE